MATLAISLVTAVATVTYACYARRQWQTMGAQLGQMRSGSKDTHDLAVAGAEQARASRSAAEFAKSQAEAALAQVKELAGVVRESHALAQAARDSVRPTSNCLLKIVEHGSEYKHSNAKSVSLNREFSLSASWTLLSPIRVRRQPSE